MKFITYIFTVTVCRTFHRVYICSLKEWFRVRNFIKEIITRRRHFKIMVYWRGTFEHSIVWVYLFWIWFSWSLNILVQKRPIQYLFNQSPNTFWFLHSGQDPTVFGMVGCVYGVDSVQPSQLRDSNQLNFRDSLRPKAATGHGRPSTRITWPHRMERTGDLCGLLHAGTPYCHLYLRSFFLFVGKSAAEFSSVCFLTKAHR